MPTNIIRASASQGVVHPGASFLVGEPAPTRQGLCLVCTVDPTTPMRAHSPSVHHFSSYLTVAQALQRNPKIEEKKKNPQTQKDKKQNKTKKHLNRQNPQIPSKQKNQNTQGREFLSAERQYLQSPSQTEHNISGHTQWHDPDDRDNRSWEER